MYSCHLVYNTPSELLMFYDIILGKVSTIVLLLLIANCCGIPAAIIYFNIVVIANRIEDKMNF